MVKYFSWFKARDFRRRESEIREVVFGCVLLARW